MGFYSQNDILIMVCARKQIAFAGKNATGSKIMTVAAQNLKVFLYKIMVF